MLGAINGVNTAMPRVRAADFCHMGRYFRLLNAENRLQTPLYVVARSLLHCCTVQCAPSSQSR